MILSAQTIRKLQPIKPFHERTVFGGMSFGLSSAGYDIRIAEEFILPSSGYKLASTVEQFDMPNDIIGMVHDKSTWARRGLSLFNTVIEPGWKGYLTLELVNHSYKPMTIESGTPIAQVVFMQLDEPTEQPYSGKYQNQKAGFQVALRER